MNRVQSVDAVEKHQQGFFLSGPELSSCVFQWCLLLHDKPDISSLTSIGRKTNVTLCKIILANKLGLVLFV